MTTRPRKWTTASQVRDWSHLPSLCVCGVFNPLSAFLNVVGFFSASVRPLPGSCKGVPVRTSVWWTLAYVFMILLCCTMSGCYIMSMKGSLLCSVSLQTLPPACEEGPVGQEFRLHSKGSAFSMLLWVLNSIIALGIFFLHVSCLCCLESLQQGK